jgi:hypothetical protein
MEHGLGAQPWKESRKRGRKEKKREEEERKEGKQEKEREEKKRGQRTKDTVRFVSNTLIQFEKEEPNSCQTPSHSVWKRRVEFVSKTLSFSSKKKKSQPPNMQFIVEHALAVTAKEEWGEWGDELRWDERKMKMKMRDDRNETRWQQARKRRKKREKIEHKLWMKTDSVHKMTLSK